VSADDRIMLITNTGRVIKCPVADIREVGRVTKGVTLMRVEEGERIVSVTRVDEGEDDGTGEGGAPDSGDDGGIAGSDEPASAPEGEE
jgi:DNA gyrase subunit A